MKNLLSLKDYTKDEINKIFCIADDIQKGKYADFLKGKTIVMFFPDSSIRTRVTFEKGIYLLGGQSILFPQSTLDKKEEIEDVIGYLNNWADAVIVRYKDIEMLKKMTKFTKAPIINAMTDINHPCEMLADMYSLSKIRKDFTKDKFLFLGQNGNIGLAWKEASEVMGFSLEQCCPKGHEIHGIKSMDNIEEAIKGKDIICTDSLSSDNLRAFEGCQITLDNMKLANKGAILNPCPPFFRREEVSEDVINSEFFVGYEFKKYLLEIQQAVIIYCMSN